jgi:hypothetical protein
MTSLLRVSLVACAGLAFGLSGCGGGRTGGGSDQSPEETTLNEVGDLLRSSTTSGRRPSRVTDLAKLEPTYPKGYKAVKSGEVVVIWGGNVAGEGSVEHAGEVIVAYEKNAPTAGGYVLFTNGKVKKQTAAEFASTPKAK